MRSTSGPDQSALHNLLRPKVRCVVTVAPGVHLVLFVASSEVWGVCSGFDFVKCT